MLSIREIFKAIQIDIAIGRCYQFLKNYITICCWSRMNENEKCVDVSLSMSLLGFSTVDYYYCEEEHALNFINSKFSFMLLPSLFQKKIMITIWSWLAAALVVWHVPKRL